MRITAVCWLPGSEITKTGTKRIVRTQTPTKTATARIRKNLKNVTVNRWLALG
jgi:hypothetical protein